MFQTLCCLLDCLLTDENTPPDSPRELYEIYFVFACVWAFGGALFQDHVSLHYLTCLLLVILPMWHSLGDAHTFPLFQLIDYRSEFSRWWCKEMRAVKFPSQGSVFDYYIDPKTKRFTPWSERTPPFELEPDIPIQVSLEQNIKYTFMPSHPFY